RRRPQRQSDVLRELHEARRQSRPERESRTGLLRARRARLEACDDAPREGGALRGSLQRHEPHEPGLADLQPSIGDVRTVDGARERRRAATHRARRPPELLTAVGTEGTESTDPTQRSGATETSGGRARPARSAGLTDEKSR